MFNFSTGKKILFSFIIFFLFLAIAELGIRGILFFTSFSKKGLDLDPYEEPDPNFGWRLKANYQQTRFSSDTSQTELLVINSKGFRGKEFDINKNPEKTRIIMMGDSVTFGITPESCPYPYQLQELFNQKYPNKIEVINAGVEGYSSEYVLKRLKYDIIQYKPDIITVYVGWNDLYAINPLAPWQYQKLTKVADFLNHFYLYKAYRKVIFQWLKPKLGTLFNAPKEANYVITKYQSFVPEKYKSNLREIIKICRNNNIKIVLINLAGILSDKMTESDIKKVHYPYFTNNIKNIKLLQDIYNKTIEEIAEKENISLIDLNKAINQVPNKGKLFFDTMHPYCEGNKIIAKIIFENLINQKIVNF